VNVSAAPAPAAFRLAGVHQSYRAGAESLHDLTLDIGVGEHVAIVGANGSGKSTLLKVLDGLVFCSAGTVEAFGKPLTEDALEEDAFRREFRTRVGFVFQDADVQLFCSNVFDELAFGPLQLGLAETDVRERIAEVAAGLRLEKLLDRAPYTLSGGEKKRVAIASVLAMRPDALLMDEPANALDPRSQVWLLEVLAEMKRAGRTVIIATHDLSTAEEACDRMVVLSEDHRVVADGTPADVLSQRDLLLQVNLIHEHSHRHRDERLGELEHGHPHEHGHLHT
jgi:cobalt/nickel transport system ATP-binding protein